MTSQRARGHTSWLCVTSKLFVYRYEDNLQVIKVVDCAREKQCILHKHTPSFAISFCETLGVGFQTTKADLPTAFVIYGIYGPIY